MSLVPARLHPRPWLSLPWPAVDIQEVVQRLGAAQQGVPQEAVEGTVRALRGVYNGALISLMIECEEGRVAAERAESERRAAREQADAARNNETRLARRVNTLVGTRERLQEENSRLQGEARRLQQRAQRQWWLLLPSAAGGFALGVLACTLAAGRARSRAARSSRQGGAGSKHAH